MGIILLLQTTNRGGVEWLKRHLAPKGYRVHSLLFMGTQNCHADATFLPLSKTFLFIPHDWISLAVTSSNICFYLCPQILLCI